MTNLAWPAACVAIGLLFMLIFREPISRLLDRTRKIGKTGLEAGLEGSANTQITNIERRTSGAEELLASFDSALTRDREELIRKSLNEKRVDEPMEREKVLVRHLAAALNYLQCEQTYHTIFGSQIRMLQALNSAGLCHKFDVKAFYDDACLLEPQFYSDYSFEQWLSYLESRLLVRIEGSEMVGITVFGREFLKFLVSEGRSINRAG